MDGEEERAEPASMTVSRSVDHPGGTSAADRVLTASAVSYLQRTAGNSAVSRLLGHRASKSGLPTAQATQPAAGLVGVQRKTDPVHLRPLRPGAQGCMVHLHGDERNALTAARRLYQGHCVNLVYIDHPGRRLIGVDVPGHRGVTCRADPNRIFDNAAITRQWAEWNSGACLRPSVRPDAEAAVRNYRDTELQPRIEQCRGGAAGAGPSGGAAVGGLPVVAFHNNSPSPGTAGVTRRGNRCQENLTIRSYLPGHCEAAATETDQARITGQQTPSVSLPNPAIVPGQDIDNFLLVTDPGEFRRLRATRNVVLQVRNPPNDGSLSVALSAGRYVNVEAESTPGALPVNQAMGAEALAALGIGPLPCPGQPLPARQAGQQAGHLTSADLPAQSSPSRDDFMRDVYDRQVALAIAAGRSYTHSVPAGELVPLSASDALPGRGVKLHKSVTTAINALLSAARGALASAKTSVPPDPAARRVDGIRVRSGYRSAPDQKSIWQREYPRYYRETSAHRNALPGGPHGAAAVDFLAGHINVRVFSPGYSPHQTGRTVDLTYRENGIWAQASTAPADLAKWSTSWLFTWLKGNAGSHGFALNPTLNEPWHWEHP